MRQGQDSTGKQMVASVSAVFDLRDYTNVTTNLGLWPKNKVELRQLGFHEGRGNDNHFDSKGGVWVPKASFAETMRNVRGGNSDLVVGVPDIRGDFGRRYEKGRGRQLASNTKNDAMRASGVLSQQVIHLQGGLPAIEGPTSLQAVVNGQVARAEQGDKRKKAKLNKGTKRYG